MELVQTAETRLLNEHALDARSNHGRGGISRYRILCDIFAFRRWESFID